MTVVMNNPLEVEIELSGPRGLNSDDLFKLAEALDAYEVELGVKERLVVDMAELNVSGLIKVSVIPKDMLGYQEIHTHIHILMEQAIVRAGLKRFDYRVVRVIFHPISPGIPSRMAEEIGELKSKVEKLWLDKYGEQMKSYA